MLRGRRTVMSKQRDTQELNKPDDDQAPTLEEAAPSPMMVALDEMYIESGRGVNRVRIPLDFADGAECTVGRGYERDPVELDLTPYGAFDYGVSRRHALLATQRDGVYVTDLGSTNGTRINGFLLVPDRAYRLRNGDELEFGRLRLMVCLVK